MAEKNSYRILKNTGCQDLMSLEGFAHSGWIRKQTTFHRKFARYPFISKLVPWFNKYVVLTRGCAYVYKNENSTLPSEAFLLLDFTKVSRAQEIPPNIVPWAFRLEHKTDKMKLRFFACSSEHEMKLWMIEFKKEMYVANVLPPKAKKFIQELDMFKQQVADDDDSGLYVYIEESVSGDSTMTRGLSTTSIHNEDCGVSSLPSGSKTLPKPRPPPKPPGKIVHSKSAKFARHNNIGNSEADHKYEEVVRTDDTDEPYCDDVLQNLWSDAMWTGAKAAGDSCIRDQNQIGVYLIRYTDNGQQAVLVVHIPSKTKQLCKFKIIEKDKIFLREDKKFSDGEALLAYYRNNNLPGFQVRLTKPYRQI